MMKQDAIQASLRDRESSQCSAECWPDVERDASGQGVHAVRATGGYDIHPDSEVDGGIGSEAYPEVECIANPTQPSEATTLKQFH